MTDTGSATLKQVAHRVPPATHERIKRLARLRGRNAADEYRDATDSWLEQHRETLEREDTAQTNASLGSES